MKPYLKPFLSALLCICLPVTSFFTGPGINAAAAAGTTLSFPAAQDAFVSNFNGQGNALGTSLSAAKLIYGKSRHAYLKFDLSSIDTDRYDTGEMTMQLSFRKSHAPNELVFTESESVLRNTDKEWTVTNVTYNTRPYDIAGSPAVTRAVSSTSEENLTLDLSTIFQNALNNGRKVVSIHLTTAKAEDNTVSASELFSSRNTSGFPGPVLNVTLGDPVVNDGSDRTALNGLITQAEQLIETAYTRESWAIFMAALHQARALSINDATQAEVDEARLTLQTAMDNLAVMELPSQITGQDLGDYYSNSQTAAMILKMRNGDGQYVKVDPVTEKLSLTSDPAEASAFALYVLDYFATVELEEPEAGATRTAYSIKSLDTGKYLTIQNYFTEKEFLDNTHRYFNMISGAASGVSTDRTFEIKASAVVAGWNERFYVDQYTESGFYRIFSHLSIMRDDSNFSRFNVTMTDGAMQSSGRAAENTEYRFYFEQVNGKDPLEISQKVSGDTANLLWKPVNGDTDPASYKVNGMVTDAVYSDGLMQVKLQDLSAGTHAYTVEFNGDGYSAKADVNVRIFSHPGILLSMQDLEDMKVHVQAKQEPWYSDYRRLVDSVPYGVASSGYQTKVFSKVGRGGAPSDSGNIGYFEKGGNAAYFNALQWVITGDDQYADMASGLLSEWAKALKVIDGRDRILGAGINAYKYASAAEIIRYYGGGYSGYSDEDFAALQDMMLNVVYPVIQDAAVPMLANGNWDAAAIVSMMAIGVLCDNTGIFERAMGFYQDIHTNGSIFAYVNDAGQTMETGRDQAHAMLALGYMAEICLIAGNQNEDLASLYDNRLAKAFEYSAQYNLYSQELSGVEVPFTAMPNVFGDTGRGYYGTGFDMENNGLNRGELRPVFEQGLALYSKADGVDMTWTARAAAAMRPQGMVHFDNLNFGTLTYYNGEPQTAVAGPYFQMRTRWEPLYQRNWSTVNGQKTAETLNSYYAVNADGELTTSSMKQDAPFFRLVAGDDGTYSILLLETNKYLSVKEEKSGDYNLIKADAAEIGDNERFILRSSGVGPFYLASAKYDNRIVYQEAAGAGSNAVLTIRLGSKTLSQITDIPDITTSERLIFMFNTEDIALPDGKPVPSQPENPAMPGGVQAEVAADNPKISLNGISGTLSKNENGGYSLLLGDAQIGTALGGGGELIINAEDIDNLTVQFSAAAMGTAKLTIKSGYGTVSLPGATLQMMKKKLGDSLVLRISKASYTVELLKDGKPAVYSEPGYPLTITLPVEVSEGRNINEYTVVKKENGKDVILPLAAAAGNSVTFTAAATGTYDVVYNGQVFHDVPSVHWAAQDIAFVAARGLFGGTGKELFDPRMPMTRAMFTRVLANLEGVDLGSYAAPVFTDVPAGKWYASAVAWAAQSGIVNGTGQGLFSPDAVITREQMAVMLHNYTASKGYTPHAVTTAEFTDAGRVSAWAQQAVEALAAAGILSGKPGDYADPQGETSRAEAAVVFARLIQAWGAEAL